MRLLKVLMVGFIVLILGIPAQSQIVKVRGVKHSSEAEMLRRESARELRKLGFTLTRDFGKSQLYEHWDANSGFIYQIWLKGNKNQFNMDGYAFLKGEYPWKYHNEAAGEEAAKYITNIVNYCITEGKRKEELAPYVRARYRYHEMGIHTYTPADTSHY